ncbi:carcinoembryonic antigen-related cell adhesion molecule 3-like [Anolis sagrei]|uniref:carcinoembryonic antigen-related cell adhesion molecule 3-like n=1 Tax=Anolis sagrei TaxID=38937 RepID=UPI0035222440
MAGKISCLKTQSNGRSLLFAVLSWCFLLTRAQRLMTTTTLVDPSNPSEGENVSLIPDVGPRNLTSCQWFRGRVVRTNTILIYFFSRTPKPGPNYTGRETVDSNCSLHITNLAGNYSGTYTFLLQFMGGAIKGEVELLVSARPPPSENEETEHSTGLIAGIVVIIVSLALGLALIGGLLYLFLRIRRQKPTSDPIQSGPTTYENLPRPGQRNIGENPGNSSDPSSHTYQTPVEQQPEARRRKPASLACCCLRGSGNG